MKMTELKIKKYRVWFTLKDGTSSSMLIPARNKEAAIEDVKTVWYGYNPQIKQVKLEK